MPTNDLALTELIKEVGRVGSEVTHLRADFEGFTARMEQGPIDITRIRLSVVTAVMLAFVVMVNLIGPAIFHFAWTAAGHNSLVARVDRLEGKGVGK